ncbi:MAG: chloride channel protein [bacterium]|nr:chloride channel protein [bacterium]
MNLSGARPLVLLAVVIGVLGAAGNVVFRLAIEGFGLLFGAVAAPFGHLGIPLALLAGGVVLLVLDRFFPGEVLGYGFPRFLEMLHLQGARVKRRWIVLKTLGTGISLGAGAAVGREGPIAQIGGSIGGLVAWAARLSVDDRKVLIACGAAAGIAATFNAPLAAILFAQEIVLLGQAELSHLTLVVVAAATAVAATRQLFGAEPVLNGTTFTFVSYWECFTYAAMGVGMGLLAVAYIRSFHFVAGWMRRLPAARWAVLLGGLLVVGLIDVAVPQNLADGYPVINEALASQIHWEWALVLMAAKFVGSIVSLGCGAPGGVFGPIFFIGAMAGCAFRAVSALVLPTLTGPHGSYAMVGLGAFLAATTHAPLTAMFLLLEMTQNYAVTVPALLAVGAALVVSQRLEPESIDTYGLHAEGKELHGATLPQLMDHVPLGSGYRPDVPRVEERMPLRDILRLVSEGAGTTLPVVDAQGELTGVLSFGALREVLLEDSLDSVIVAADLANPHAPVLTPASSLGDAFRELESARLDALPVVDPAHPKRVLGMLSRGDLIAAYNHAVSTLGTLPLDAWIGSNESHWAGGYRVARIDVPASWVGRSLRDIDCRGRYGVTVLAVRTPVGHELPDPARPLEAGDELTVAGTAENVRAVRAVG